MSHSLKDVAPRCGQGCRGFGMGAVNISNVTKKVPLGCSGELILPPLGEGDCGNNVKYRLLEDFEPNPSFALPINKTCHDPVCPALYGRRMHVRPKHKRRPVKIHAKPEPGKGDMLDKAIVTFSKNHVPERSDLLGPFTVECTDHSKRLTIGEGATIKGIRVSNCSGMCPIHVKLRDSGKEHTTKILNVSLLKHVDETDVLAEAKMCAVLVTPVSSNTHPRHFVGRGTVRVETQYGHDIAVANVNGELVVRNYGKRTRQKTNVTLLDSLEDSAQKLKVTVESGSGPVQIVNLTAVMDVFSQEYLVDFFGPSPRKENEMKGLMRLNWALAGIILALLAGDPDTIPRALPKAWSKKRVKKTE